MKIVVAPDSWSGFLSSPEIAAAIGAALREAGHSVTELPMADGGVGTGEALRRVGATAAPAMVTGPNGDKVLAATFDFDGTNFVEACQAVGAHLCEDDDGPLTRSSRGLGELIRRTAATRDGPIIVGLGGSATMDGGLGFALGLGLQAFDADGEPLPIDACATDLGRVARLQGAPPLRDRLVMGWADVYTPLLESAAIFGPQKGADEMAIAQVTMGLGRWAEVLGAWRAANGLAPLPANRAFGGAAGGLGYALAALLDAPLVAGAAAVARAVGLDDAIDGADVVITGEGRIDQSSFQGKVAGEVTQRARRHGARVLVLAGASAGDLPPAPIGPDVLLTCDDRPGDTRDDRLEAALEKLVQGLVWRTDD